MRARIGVRVKPVSSPAASVKCYGLIQADMSNKEIARTLGIELSTVKNRVHTTVEELSYEFRPAIRP